MNFEFKRDSYRSSRGDYSRIVNLSCRCCKKQFAVYQKDGPGKLRRLYFDRLLHPSDYSLLQDKDIEEVDPLVCKYCNESIGTPYVYSKENRKAFKVYQDMIISKIRRSKIK